MMLMSREVCLPALLMKGEIINDMPAGQYLCDLVTRLHTVHQQFRGRLQSSNDESDRLLTAKQYSEGQLV